MISATFFALLAAGQKDATALDFFPLNPGDRYVYEEEYNKMKKLFTDVVGAPKDINGRVSYPVETLTAGQSLGKVYYNIDKDRVLVTGMDFGDPIASPYPILVVGKGTQKFSWAGEVPVPSGTPEPLAIVGEAKPGRAVELFGKRRATVEITLNMDLLGLLTVQKSVYAEGLGLVSMVEETGKKKVRRTRKLVSYEPAGGS